MKLKDIDKYYDNLLIPLSLIKDPERWLKKEIFSFRCSVFPVFYHTLQEIIDNVDSISESQVSEYRNRFLGFLNNLCLDFQVYKRIQSLDELILVNNIIIDDVIDFTEKSNIDFFIPSLSIIFIGHDDFGFIILFHKKNIDSAELINNLLNKYNLFMLK